MKELYAQYGEIIIIDATYKINTSNYSLYLFIVIDNNGNSQICILSLAAFERDLLEHFTNTNDIIKTQVILSDKDMVESNGFKLYFPNARHIMFCKLEDL